MVASVKRAMALTAKLNRLTSTPSTAWLARQLAEGKLVRVLPNSELEAVPVSVVYQTGRVQSGGLKSFVGAARAALPGCPEL
jgi:DNA-binding transcriptional LysR family regulator